MPSTINDVVPATSKTIAPTNNSQLCIMVVPLATITDGDRRRAVASVAVAAAHQYNRMRTTG